MFKNRRDRQSQDMYEKRAAHHTDDSDSDVEQMTSSRIEPSKQNQTYKRVSTAISLIDCCPTTSAT